MRNEDLAADCIERADGAPLIAFAGSDTPESRYRLGTVQYDWHSHVRGQVFCVESGLVHVRTAHGSWLLPPHRAGWIPPGEPHWVHMVGAQSGWGVIVAPEAARHLPDHPAVFGISEVMRALVRRAVCWEEKVHLQPAQERLMEVLLDEMVQAPQERLHLPMPREERLARIARALFDAPDDPRGLEAWAAWGGVSPRSLRRMMLAETGMSFGAWRQQAGLVRALEMLALGQPVAVVSDALGYASPSNFIAMFRRAFGETPARYFTKGRGKDGDTVLREAGTRRG